MCLAVLRVRPLLIRAAEIALVCVYPASGCGSGAACAPLAPDTNATSDLSTPCLASASLQWIGDLPLRSACIIIEYAPVSRNLSGLWGAAYASGSNCSTSPLSVAPLELSSSCQDIAPVHQYWYAPHTHRRSLVLSSWRFHRPRLRRPRRHVRCAHCCKPAHSLAARSTILISLFDSSVFSTCEAGQADFVFEVDAPFRGCISEIGNSSYALDCEHPMRVCIYLLNDFQSTSSWACLVATSQCAATIAATAPCCSCSTSTPAASQSPR